LTFLAWFALVILIANLLGHISTSLLILVMAALVAGLIQSVLAALWLYVLSWWA